MRGCEILRFIVKSVLDELEKTLEAKAEKEQQRQANQEMKNRKDKLRGKEKTRNSRNEHSARKQGKHKHTKIRKTRPTNDEFVMSGGKHGKPDGEHEEVHDHHSTQPSEHQATISDTGQAAETILDATPKSSSESPPQHQRTDRPISPLGPPPKYAFKNGFVHHVKACIKYEARRLEKEAQRKEKREQKREEREKRGEKNRGRREREEEEEEEEHIGGGDMSGEIAYERNDHSEQVEAREREQERERERNENAEELEEWEQ